MIQCIGLRKSYGALVAVHDLDLEIAPNTAPVVVGRQAADVSPLSIPIPQRAAAGDCWSAAPRTGRRR